MLGPVFSRSSFIFPLPRNTRLVAESLACTLYSLPSELCDGSIFTGSNAPNLDAIRMWTSQMSEKPRGTSLLLGAKNLKRSKASSTPGYGKEATSQTVKVLTEALKTYTHEVGTRTLLSMHS